MPASPELWRTQARSIMVLGGPLIINYLAVAGMGLADTLMSGRLGASSLAAVAVGNSIWMLNFTACLGILMAISPIIARLYGAGETRKVGRYTRHGMYLGLVLGIIVVVAGRSLMHTVLEIMSIDAGFRDLTLDYARAVLLGAPGIFIFLALRFTTEGVGYTRPIMFTSVFSLICNVFLNYVLMFGHFGAPALGAEGCGYASAITMWIVAIALGSYMTLSPRLRDLKVFTRLGQIRPALFREIIVLGVPISITITAEVGLFSAISILVGTRGAEITAAHQIALSYASAMFMIPLALSSATTVQVGHMLGAGRPVHARVAGFAGIGMCAAFMAISALVLLLFGDFIVTLYTDDPVVTGIAMSLMFVAAIFQVADGIQIGAASALRAYKDTAFPMVINIFSYWVVAFPLGYMAAITYRLPANQIWAAFIAGLGLAAIFLSWRYNRLSRT
ncbi:MAG: MATE family efflux transporter [Gammaproteobacteria bacterium]|nr:MATE family efflux transporter [Gammaproteobacteria bacterium]MDH5618134.1 MATE family efflux transporter [Gammaproteobacteria bacterium]